MPETQLISPDGFQSAFSALVRKAVMSSNMHAAEARIAKACNIPGTTAADERTAIIVDSTAPP